MEIKERVESLWYEKWRPKTLDDMILDDDFRKSIERYFKEKKLTNLLFYGSPGGGKTTLALIICSPNGIIQHPMENVLFVSGSSKKHRSIKFIDEVVEPFLVSPPFGEDNYKVVFIDEGDNLSPDAFLSLRYIIEKFSKKSGRFILTCNYPNKIPDPVRSRFDEYYFKQISFDKTLIFCKNILEKENIKYKEEDVKKIIEMFYPDVRKIINKLERSSISGTELFIDKNVLDDNENKIILLVKEIIQNFIKKNKRKASNNLHNIVDILSSNKDINYSNLYTKLFADKNIPSNVKVIINKYANNHKDCLVDEMHFVAMIFEIGNMIKEMLILSSKK